MTDAARQPTRPLSDNFLAEQALKGLAMRIERATLCWETPLTCEESVHIATSLLTMLFPTASVTAASTRLMPISPALSAPVHTPVRARDREA